MLSFINTNKIDELPKRIIFGLPHNYYFKSVRKKASIPAHSFEIVRRASPLFIKIVKVQNKYAAIGLILKSNFLHNISSIKIQAVKEPVSVPLKTDWSVIDSFFDRFDCKEEIK